MKSLRAVAVVFAAVGALTSIVVGVLLAHGLSVSRNAMVASVLWLVTPCLRLPVRGVVWPFWLSVLFNAVYLASAAGAVYYFVQTPRNIALRIVIGAVCILSTRLFWRVAFDIFMFLFSGTLTVALLS